MIRRPGQGERVHLDRKAMPDEKGLTASRDSQASLVRKASAASRDRRESPDRKAHAASPVRPVNCRPSSR
jgi:hypothetical protein